MDKSKYAGELFKSGFNCAQSVLCAFADELGIDTDTAAKFASGFGGGMGRMREVCGAVSGATMVLSLKYGYTKADDTEGKKELYRKIQEFSKRFSEENGSIICKNLLSDSEDASHIPSERTKEYYKKRPCKELVECAAKILKEEF